MDYYLLSGFPVVRLFLLRPGKPNPGKPNPGKLNPGKLNL
jgi:hypothetical protein